MERCACEIETKALLSSRKQEKKKFIGRPQIYGVKYTIPTKNKLIGFYKNTGFNSSHKATTTEYGKPCFIPSPILDPFGPVTSPVPCFPQWSVCWFWCEFCYHE